MAKSFDVVWIGQGDHRGRIRPGDGETVRLWLNYPGSAKYHGFPLDADALRRLAELASRALESAAEGE
jgi:hypothetical protein